MTQRRRIRSLSVFLSPLCSLMLLLCGRIPFRHQSSGESPSKLIPHREALARPVKYAGQIKHSATSVKVKQCSSQEIPSVFAPYLYE